MVGEWNDIGVDIEKYGGVDFVMCVYVCCFVDFGVDFVVVLVRGGFDMEF